MYQASGVDEMVYLTFLNLNSLLQLLSSVYDMQYVVCNSLSLFGDRNKANHSLLSTQIEDSLL